MKTNHPFGGPHPLPSAAASRKRPAEQAALSSQDPHDCFTKRRGIGEQRPSALRMPSLERYAIAAFMPTPNISAPSVSGWTETFDVALSAPPGSPTQSSVPTPSPCLENFQAKLTPRERQILAGAAQWSSPAKGLEYCLRTWMRYGSGKLDVQALENVVRALGQQYGLDATDFRLCEALRIVTLTRDLFGTTVEPHTRSAWCTSLIIDIQDKHAIDDNVWERRTNLMTRLQELRDVVGPEHCDVVTEKVLVAVARGTSSLVGLYDLLGRHAALGMSLGNFAKFVLDERTDAWLQNADWTALAAITDMVAQLGQHPPHAQLLAAIFTLRRSDIEQVRRLLSHLCEGADAPTAKALQLALLSAIDKLGYNAVFGCRALLVKHLDTRQRLDLVTALSHFSDPSTGLLAAQVVRAALLACIKPESKQGVIELFVQHAGAHLQERHELLTSLQVAKLEGPWAMAMLRLSAHGVVFPHLVDLAAAEVLLGGKISDGNIMFRSADRSWQTSVANIDLLMRAAKQWGLLESRSSLNPTMNWLADGAGEAILHSGGQVVPHIRDATEIPQLRIAYAQAVRNVPAAQMSACIHEVARLGQSWALEPRDRARLAEAMVAMVQIDAGYIAEAMATRLLLRINPHVSHARRSIVKFAVAWSGKVQLLVGRLQKLSSQSDAASIRTAAAMAVAEYYETFVEGRLPEATARLQRLLAACEPWLGSVEDTTRPLANLLKVELRVGPALPQFLERAGERGVPNPAIWVVMAYLARTPIDGITARICLAAIQTDDVLAQIAATENFASLTLILQQVVIEARARMANTENVHDAVRIRATEAATTFLRNLDSATPLDAPAKLATMVAFIDDLGANNPPDSMWFRRRTAVSRTTLENARYVTVGAYHPGQDLSRSVAETPAYLDVCALVWRAIDLYKHPSGATEATVREQKLMREDVVLGLAECVSDQHGFRVCPVGFKQRVIGILQGDDRYPQVFVDATNAAQMLTVVGQEFAFALDGRDPTQPQVATFVERSRALARARLADEPGELAKFYADLDAWVAMDYDYEPATGSPSH